MEQLLHITRYTLDPKIHTPDFFEYDAMHRQENLLPWPWQSGHGKADSWNFYQESFALDPGGADSHRTFSFFLF